MVTDNSSYSLFKKLNLSNIYNNISKPVIIADNLRTPENMGSVLRLAGNIGVKKVFFVNDNGTLVRNWKIKKTASGAEKKVDWEFCDYTTLFKKLPDDYMLVGIETTGSATNIFDTVLPDKVAFIIGNEIYGIGDKLLTKVDKTVYIPVPGVISSLNVTHALGVVLFEWLRKNMDFFKNK